MLEISSGDLFEGKQTKIIRYARKENGKKVEMEKEVHRSSFHSLTNAAYVISFFILSILK